jgi:hypothetical protein
MTKLRIYFILLALSLGLSISGNCQAAVIEDSTIVTDVTPVQFCVVWGTSGPASGSIRVFLDADGTIPYADAVVSSESAKHPPAQDLGVMKLKVLGLKPDSRYFFQIESTNTNDSTIDLYPNGPPFIEVSTEKSSIIVRNDVFAQEAYFGKNQPAPGMLVIASLGQASYPVTGWVGHGVPEQWAAIDMNNFYDKVTHENLELPVGGGDVVTLILFGGSLGSVKTLANLPPETGGMQPSSVAVSLPDPGSTSASAASSSGGGGGSCFIATAAFGSEMEHHVQTLSKFRDQRLLTNSVGRKFVDLYYRTSPPVADYLRKHPIPRAAIRYALVPITGVAHLALFIHPLLLLLATTLLLSGAYICFKRRLRSRI